MKAKFESGTMFDSRPRRPRRKFMSAVFLESAYKTTKLHDRSKTVTSRSSPAYERPKVTKIKGIDPPYEIKIRGEMLGLTVENILENTYIRTVVPSGMAASAGAKVGCVISQIGMYYCGRKA